MNARARLWCPLFACVAVAMVAGRAEAQWGYSYPYLGANPYSIYVNDQRLPYFAQHPPVYYSTPVHRTYGYSPYAYPPGYTTPTTSRAVTIINPFVAQPAPAPAGESPSAPGPRTIINPFVAK